MQSHPNVFGSGPGWVYVYVQHELDKTKIHYFFIVKRKISNNIMRKLRGRNIILFIFFFFEKSELPSFMINFEIYYLKGKVPINRANVCWHRYINVTTLTEPSTYK